jgi:hypothetical protein
MILGNIRLAGSIGVEGGMKKEPAKGVSASPVFVSRERKLRVSIAHI